MQILQLMSVADVLQLMSADSRSLLGLAEYLMYLSLTLNTDESVLIFNEHSTLLSSVPMKWLGISTQSWEILFYL